jgi:hypothetical protein
MRAARAFGHRCRRYTGGGGGEGTHTRARRMLDRLATKRRSVRSVSVNSVNSVVIAVWALARAVEKAVDATQHAPGTRLARVCERDLVRERYEIGVCVLGELTEFENEILRSD